MRDLISMASEAYAIFKQSVAPYCAGWNISQELVLALRTEVIYIHRELMR